MGVVHYVMIVRRCVCANSSNKLFVVEMFYYAVCLTFSPVELQNKFPYGDIKVYLILSNVHRKVHGNMPVRFLL